MNDELLIPLTEIEKAELSHACSEFLTEPGKSMMRRLLFQFDLAKQQLTAERAARERLVADLADSQQQLRYWWQTEHSCPCGARPESPKTHPHVGGCPTAKAFSDQLAALDTPEGA